MLTLFVDVLDVSRILHRKMFKRIFTSLQIEGSLIVSIWLHECSNYFAIIICNSRLSKLLCRDARSLAHDLRI